MNAYKISIIKEYISKNSNIEVDKRNKMINLLEKMLSGNIKKSEKNNLIHLLEDLKNIFSFNIKEYENRSGSNILGKGKILYGDFEETIKLYNGYPWNEQEILCIKNLKNPKYYEFDKHSIKYIKTDQFLNDSIAVILKLREDKKYVYTAFINVRGKKYEEIPRGEKDTESQSVIKEDEIRIIKSIPFNDEDGKDILANFIVKIYSEIM